MIDTIIFDVGMVLADFCWREYLESFLYPEDVTERIANAMFLSKDWIEFDRGALSDKEILEHFISNAPGCEKEINEVFKAIKGVVKPYEYSLPWIKELKKKGYKIYILSNFSKKVFEETKEIMDFLPAVDGAIFSYEVALVKPEREIYEALIQKYGIVPECAVFLDDSAANAEGARNIGMAGIHFRTKEEAEKELRLLGVQ